MNSFVRLLILILTGKIVLQHRFEWKKNRTVTLNLANNQVADVRNNELIIGTGYRFDDVQIIVKTGGRQRAIAE